MIEVFKTDVASSTHALILTEVLSWHFPLSRITFDLDDHDKVLRIECTKVSPEMVVSLLRDNGCICEPLI